MDDFCARGADGVTVRRVTLFVVVFKMAGGPTHFQSKNRFNWNHEDGIYGWSALQPNLLATPPTILEGGHFDAFSGQANLKALSDGLAALVRVAQC